VAGRDPPTGGLVKSKALAVHWQSVDTSVSGHILAYDCGLRYGNSGTEGTMGYSIIGITLVLVVLLLFPFFLWVYQPFWVIRILSRLFTKLILYVPTEKNVFAITFDDGPNPLYTDGVLSILRKHDVKATFFVVGERVETHPEYIEIIRKEGHQLCNHLYSTTMALLLSRQQFVESLLRTEELINEQNDPKLVRPPSSLFRFWMFDLAKTYGYSVVLGSAYTLDWCKPPRWYMRWALKRMLRPGIIVVVHDGGGNRQRTLDVLPDVIVEAQRRNLRPVTLDELIRSSDRNPGSNAV